MDKNNKKSRMKNYNTHTDDHWWWTFIPLVWWWLMAPFDHSKFFFVGWQIQKWYNRWYMIFGFWVWRGILGQTNNTNRKIGRRIRFVERWRDSKWLSFFLFPVPFTRMAPTMSFSYSFNGTAPPPQKKRTQSYIFFFFSWQVKKELNKESWWFSKHKTKSICEWIWIILRIIIYYFFAGWAGASCYRIARFF